MLSNSYFDILPMSKSILTSKVFNLEVCYKICYPCDIRTTSLMSNNNVKYP